MLLIIAIATLTVVLIFYVSEQRLKNKEEKAALEQRLAQPVVEIEEVPELEIEQRQIEEVKQVPELKVEQKPKKSAPKAKKQAAKKSSQKNNKK